MYTHTHMHSPVKVQYFRLLRLPQHGALVFALFLLLFLGADSSGQKHGVGQSWSKLNCSRLYCHSHNN